MRACGPFINPDDFALPAMLRARTSCREGTPLRYTRRLTGFKLISAAGAFTIAAAILLSFSRAGWAAAGVGVAAFLMLMAASPEQQHHHEHHDTQSRSSTTAVPSRRSWMPFVAGLGILAILIPLGVIMIAPSISMRGAAGFEASAGSNANLGLGGRLAIWRDTISMIRDFPLLGVGLGGWPAIFPHYRSRPWFPLAFREAHNDYLQLFAETGVVGVALVGWILFVALRGLIRGRRNVTFEDWPLLAALIAAVPFMALP